MGLGGVILALSAVQAVSQIGQGYVQKAEANLNAVLLQGKADLIDVQKGIESAQYNRLKGQYMSSSMANIAASGIRPSGSPMAVILDAQKQINLDQAIGQFNLEQQKRYTLAEAEAQKRAGKRAVTAGYTNAFSSLLSGMSSYATYKGYGFNTDAGAKTGGIGSTGIGAGSGGGTGTYFN